MIGHTSPFQKWMNENLQGIAFSQEILEIVATAFAGGLERAAQECDLIAQETDEIAKSKFVSEFGRALHEGMCGGATNCGVAIRALK